MSARAIPIAGGDEPEFGLGDRQCAAPAPGALMTANVAGNRVPAARCRMNPGIRAEVVINVGTVIQRGNSAMKALTLAPWTTVLAPSAKPMPAPWTNFVYLWLSNRRKPR